MKAFFTFLTIVFGVVLWLWFTQSPQGGLISVHEDSNVILGEDMAIADARQTDQSSLLTSARLERVVDGDTLIVSDIPGNPGSHRVRLIGIDTPELARNERPAECYAEEARNFLQELLPVGTEVWLAFDESQGDTDEHGRLLAYTYFSEDEVSEPSLLNALLVFEGYAYEYTYDEPYRFQLELRTLEETARSFGNGLWSMCE